MVWKAVMTLGLGAALATSAAAAPNPASKLSLANAQGAQEAQGLLLCPEGQSSITLADGTQQLCCPANQARITLPDGTERSCLAARPQVRKGLGFFGYSAIGLAASGGAAAAAQSGNGRPASP